MGGALKDLNNGLSFSPAFVEAAQNGGAPPSQTKVQPAYPPAQMQPPMPQNVPNYPAYPAPPQAPPQKPAPQLSLGEIQQLNARNPQASQQTLADQLYQYARMKK